MADGFLLADCTECERRVLLAHDLADGELITRCLHCDSVIDRETAIVASPDQLRDAGYIVGSDAGSDGERGCRDGQCGVVQPDQ